MQRLDHALRSLDDVIHLRSQLHELRTFLERARDLLPPDKSMEALQLLAQQSDWPVHQRDEAGKVHYDVEFGLQYVWT